MKKIFAVLICFQLLTLPASAEYDFSDEAQRKFDETRFQQIYPQNNDFTKTKNQKTDQTPKQESYEPVNLNQNKPLYGSVANLPAGTTFDVIFDSGISSSSLEKDDRLTAKLVNALKYNGQLIAPAGSLVYGSATDATKSAGYAYGSGVIELNFNQILSSDGELINISTEKIYLKAKSERAQKMTRDVVIGALGSMLVGAAFTALGGGDDWGRNMAIYGGLGALGGGFHGAMQRGQDIKIPDGTTIKVRLSEPLGQL